MKEEEEEEKDIDEPNSPLKETEENDIFNLNLQPINFQVELGITED